MAGKSEDSKIEEIINSFMEDKVVINGIKGCLNRLKSLEEFTSIPLNFVHDCGAVDDGLFPQLLKSKIIAQQRLNYHYNRDYSTKCSLIEPMSNCESDADDPVSSVLRFIVLFRVVREQEEHSTKVTFRSKIRQHIQRCLYCDSDINEGESRCPVCLADYNDCSNIRYIEDMSKTDFCVGTMPRVIAESDPELIKDTEDPKDIWICPSCTFNNELESQCCTVCFTFQESKVFQNDNDENVNTGVTLSTQSKWRCNKCRCDNSFDTYKCSSCQTLAPFFNKWVCDRCSFFNELSSHVCNACGGKNDNLGACTKCRINVADISVSKECVKCRNAIIKKKEICGSSGSFSDSNMIHDDVTTEFTEYDIVIIPTDKCILCHIDIGKQEGSFCGSCDSGMWYCHNRLCHTINDVQTGKCYRCKLKRNSNPTAYNRVDVHDGTTFVKMGQCQGCGAFRSGISCEKCYNIDFSDLKTKVSESFYGAIDKIKNFNPFAR